MSLSAQHLTVLVEDFDLVLIDAHGHFAIRRRRRRGVVRAVDLHQSCVVHNACFPSVKRGYRDEGFWVRTRCGRL
jgi:hypothetical protein